MALVLSDIGPAWGQKYFFVQESKEAANAAEKFAAAAKAAAVKAAEDFSAASKSFEEMAAKYFFVQETKEAAKVAAVKAAEDFSAASKSFEEMAAESAVAILCTQLYTAAAVVFKKESVTSKVPYGGVCQVYPCLCYPKEILKKEDEERNAPHHVPMPPSQFNVEMRKMFFEWANKHGKRYGDLYEMRLRYKIWRNAKEREEQLCSKSGQSFSMELMTKDADLTQIEYKLGNRGRVRHGVYPVSVIKKGVLDLMGESWMEKEGKEFDKWAERHNRVYSSSEEREDRRIAYLENMRIIHMWEERYPGEWGFGNDLENMDQFPWEKSLVPPVECSRCRPC